MTISGPNLRRECGVTRFSLENGEVLRQRFGRPVSVELCFKKHPIDGVPESEWPVEPCVRAEYLGSVDEDRRNGFTIVVHTFTGFAWGYGGEGPRGLATWAVDNGVPLSMREVARLPFYVENRPGVVYTFRRPLTDEEALRSSRGSA